MQDPRLILFSILIASIASYTSVSGAITAFFWLVAFAPVGQVVTGGKKVFLVFAGVFIVSCVTAITGGDGLGYGIRLSVIALAGCCAWRMFHSSDPLKISVWLFGNKKGFDLGMAASLVMTGITVSGYDLVRGMQAVRFKAPRPGARQIAVLLFMLLERSLARTEEQARLLTIRGYSGGGSYCPTFSTTHGDVIGSIMVIIVLISAFLPLSDVFILRM